MTKNLIPIIAKELGVEIGEEFAIKGIENTKYRFQSDMLEASTINTVWICSGLHINRLAEVEIIKLPFEPKAGEKFWTYWTDWSVTDFEWKDKTANFDFRKFCGCVFRTREEAIKARPEKYKELTGKEWGE
jgi:hypothetical protein